MSFRLASANLLRRVCNSPKKYLSSSFRISPGKLRFLGQHGFGDVTWSRCQENVFSWIFLSAQAAILFGINASVALAEDIPVESSSKNGADMSSLSKIEDGSIISNEHTSKWRIFTDNARELFLQGKLEQAENFFIAALREAKEGFGERDPHVASACNNLGELYRVKKSYDKAEPLYLEAIYILEESFGPDDIRVGAALHNLGQFYLVQQKLEKACACYERAIKIKRRILGEGHQDYADSMYHLGTVLYLQGNEKDAEAFIRNSIRILEEGGHGGSATCVRRLRYLAEMYIRSNRIAEAESVQRKILHTLELSKGWNSLVTVVSAERLALTLQSLGNLREAEEILERCLDARKILLPEDHIQNAANMLHIARVKILNSNWLRKTSISQAMTELDMARNLLRNSARLAQQVVIKFMKEKKKHQISKSGNDGNSAMVILLQSLDALGMLEVSKMELHEMMSNHEAHGPAEAEKAFHQCISAFKEFASKKSLADPPEVKAEYLSCLKHLFGLMSDDTTARMLQSGETTLQELKDEINHLEVELSESRRHRHSGQS